MIRPASLAILPSEEADPHGLDEWSVGRITQTVEEDNGEGERVCVRARDAGLSNGTGGPLDRRIIGWDTAFQQSQSGQGRSTNLLFRIAVKRPSPIFSLDASEKSF